jgi:glycerol-3-phosphate acyltransferase PlsY
VNLFIDILSLIIGYFIGSFLPAYVFGKLKHADLTREGTRNLGTANVYRTLGILYAVPTAIYDTLKGLFMIWFSFMLKADPFFAYLSGIMAIAGHIFPFYLKFRGGQGVACATGMLLFYLVNYFVIMPTFLLYVIYLGIIVIIFYLISKRGNLLGVMTLPMLGYGLLVYYPNLIYNLFIWIIIIQVVTIQVYNIIDRKMMIIEDETFRLHWWRVATRPIAALFILFYLIYTQYITLLIIGSVALVFILLDLIRFINKQTNEMFSTKVKAIFRKNEYKKFSSMTIFLISSFISVLLFQKAIAITALTFLIFGDLFSKIFGLAFGRHKILDWERTIEGTLANYGSVLIFGFILYTGLDISLIILIIGGITAPIVEFFSMHVNDNLTVPLISGSIMTVALIAGL